VVLGRAGGFAGYNGNKFDEAGGIGIEGGGDHWRCRQRWWW
jgi:hypothetical protein